MRPTTDDQAQATPCGMAALLLINQHLDVECHMGGCGHRRRFSAVDAVTLLGPAQPFETAKFRFRCSRCGAHGRDGHISARPCTLDWSAWTARQDAAAGKWRRVSPQADLEENLASLRQLLGDRELGGDGPVAWPPAQS